MGQLCFYLPPMSSDYSGVCSSLFELGGMIVVHDGACCSKNYTEFDEPRPIGHDQALYCSALREISIITGDDRQLIEKIKKELPAIKPPAFIALIGTPVPALIGTDLEGIAAELESETGIPSFGFNTSGMRYYNEGIEKALVALVHRFTRKPTRPDPLSVNLLGLTPLDYSANGNASSIISWLETGGLHLKCSFMMNSTLEQVQQAAEAAVNLVVSASGFRLADYMKQRWGIPYLAATPMGTDDSLIPAVRQAAKGETGSSLQHHDVEAGGLLIIGDQIIANSIRRRLAELGVKKLTVGSFFGLNRAYTKRFDVDILSEKQLTDMINSETYQAVMGDPLLRSIPAVNRMPFFEAPHMAVSGKLYWDSCRIYASEQTEAWLQECACQLKELGL